MRDLRTTLSPAAATGDKLLLLHLGRTSTYSTIGAAISANGCVALFQIHQLQRAGHVLSALLNQLWAITLADWTSEVVLTALRGGWGGRVQGSTGELLRQAHVKGDVKLRGSAGAG